MRLVFPLLYWFGLMLALIGVGLRFWMGAGSLGLAVAVADAHPGALAAAHRRTRAPGGAGAVREVCDWLLAARRRARAPR